MGAQPRFAKGVLEEIRARAATSPEVEVCGLLLGTPDRVERALACRNVSPTPTCSFEIDPAQLIAAFRAERAGGLRVIGCYHSHPHGPATPSARDAAEAAANGWLWLIVGEGDVGLFRAVGNGAVRDRFESLLVIPAKAGTHLQPAGSSPTAGAGPPLARG